PEYNVTAELAQNASMELYSYFNQLAAQRKVDPKDDLVTVLLKAEVDGERLSELELDLFFLLLSVAGNETTRNAISHGMVALSENPDQHKRLLDDPSLINTAIEELPKRLPDITVSGPVSRLRSNFINGLKHVPVTFTQTAPAA